MCAAAPCVLGHAFLQVSSPKVDTYGQCMEQPVHLLLVDINVLLLACSLPRLAPLLYQV